MYRDECAMMCEMEEKGKREEEKGGKREGFL